MGYDRTAPKRPTNLSLNADLVRRARALSPNLSETVEKLLVEHLERQDAGKQGRLDASIAAFNLAVQRRGLAGEEFDPV